MVAAIVGKIGPQVQTMWWGGERLSQSGSTFASDRVNAFALLAFTHVQSSVAVISTAILKQGSLPL